MVPFGKRHGPLRGARRPVSERKLRRARASLSRVRALCSVPARALSLSLCRAVPCASRRRNVVDAFNLLAVPSLVLPTTVLSLRHHPGA